MNDRRVRTSDLGQAGRRSADRRTWAFAAQRMSDSYGPVTAVDATLANDLKIRISGVRRSQAKVGRPQTRPFHLFDSLTVRRERGCAATEPCRVFRSSSRDLCPPQASKDFFSLRLRLFERRPISPLNDTPTMPGRGGAGRQS